MTITALPPVLDLERWDAFTATRPETETWELVRGVPEMSPSEVVLNHSIAFNLCLLLQDGLGPEWKVLPGTEVHLGRTGGRHTVRIPDVMVIPRSADPQACRVPASGVRLVAEIVSPSSVATDWLAKRDEYAAAGIPIYLVVDPRGDQPRMALFDTVADGRYTDPQPDGTRCTLTIDDTSIELRLADVLAW